MIDLGVKALEMVPLLFVLVGVFMGANAVTLVVVARVVAATNPNVDQMAVLVNFIVVDFFFVFLQCFTTLCDGVCTTAKLLLSLLFLINRRFYPPSCRSTRKDSGMGNRMAHDRASPQK